MTGGWLDIAAKVLALVSPFLLLWLGWVFKRRLDNAQARLAEAQARASDATVEKTRVEASGLVVSNAVAAAEKIVALYTAQQERDARIASQELARKDEERARKDEEAAEFRAAASTRIRHLEKQVGDLQTQQQQLATSLLPHAIWDGRIWQDAKALIDPDYAAPPSFGIDGLTPPVPDGDGTEPDCSDPVG